MDALFTSSGAKTAADQLRTMWRYFCLAFTWDAVKWVFSGTHCAVCKVAGSVCLGLESLPILVRSREAERERDDLQRIAMQSTSSCAAPRGRSRRLALRMRVHALGVAIRSQSHWKAGACLRFAPGVGGPWKDSLLLAPAHHCGSLGAQGMKAAAWTFYLRLAPAAIAAGMISEWPRRRREEPPALRPPRSKV